MLGGRSTIRATGRRPRVLLVNPSFPLNFWSFSEARDITGRRTMMNLSLPTLAALTPEEFEVSIVDENVDDLDLDLDIDIVGITGYGTQHDRMVELASAFRERGRLVVAGGPYVSLSPDAIRPHVDVLVRGEAENVWVQFLDDWRAGAHRSEYVEEGTVSLPDSPAPALDLLSNDRYGVATLQTSRGCPFSCEFCDVIVYLGRRQRHKEPSQVVSELAALHRAGYRRVFLADDNFTANHGRARDLLEAVAAWNTAQAEPMALNTQLSIDVAADRNRELLDLCVVAGIDVVFIGIETGDEAALLEVGKKQNTRRDLVESVQMMHRHGIQVNAGLMVGFDHDDSTAFDNQLALMTAASIPLVTVSPLNAPEGTPLAARLRAEGRLRGRTAMSFLDTNIEPLRMTRDELLVGWSWLMNRLYRPDAFLHRVRGLVALMPDRPLSSVAPGMTGAGLAHWARVRRSYRALGPEHAELPGAVTEAFGPQRVSQAMYALIFYRHVVGLLQAWGAYDADLAACSEVDEAMETRAPRRRQGNPVRVSIG